jgi:hypothetical protein
MLPKSSKEDGGDAANQKRDEEVRCGRCALI